MIHVLRKFFDPRGMPAPPKGRKCPAWLGNFHLKMYGRAYGKNFGPLPDYLQELHEKIDNHVGFDFTFTTWFSQTYGVGSYVNKHRDPKNNVELTYIAIYGDFEGAFSTVGSQLDEVEFQLHPGDVQIQLCTVNGVQGPQHKVSPVTKGTRYAFIGNRIL